MEDKNPQLKLRELLEKRSQIGAMIKAIHGDDYGIPSPEANIAHYWGNDFGLLKTWAENSEIEKILGLKVDRTVNALRSMTGDKQPAAQRVTRELELFQGMIDSLGSERKIG